jgi:hypothetical protein
MRRQPMYSASSPPSSTHWPIYRRWTLRTPQTSNLLRTRVGKAGIGAAILNKIAGCGLVAVRAGKPREWRRGGAGLWALWGESDVS